MNDSDAHDDMDASANDYLRCGARLTDGSGRTCGNGAGKGTDHYGIGKCYKHGGATQNHRAAARRVMIIDAAEKFGVPREVDPATGILECVHKAAGQVDFYEDEVNNLETPWIEQTVPGGKRIDEHPAITAYRVALDRLYSYSERTLKLDLFTRQVRVEEAQALVLAALVTSLLDAPEMNLTREQRELGRQLGGRKLRELAAGSTAA